MALSEEDKKRIEEEEQYRKEIRAEKAGHEKKKKWYHSSGGIILLLLLFFPVGLYLMWKHATWNKNVKWVITAIFGLYVLISAFSMNSTPSATNTSTEPVTTQENSQPEQPTKAPEPTEDTSLDATIRFNDLAIQITNNEPDDWTDCKFELNSGLFSGGYTYKQSVFPAGEVMIIPFRDFTKGDGTRFNSFETKPQNISASCDVNGTHGFSYFGIE